MIYLLDADTLIFMIRGLKSSNRHQPDDELRAILKVLSPFDRVAFDAVQPRPSTAMAAQLRLTICRYVASGKAAMDDYAPYAGIGGDWHSIRPLRIMPASSCIPE